MKKLFSLFIFLISGFLLYAFSSNIIKSYTIYKHPEIQSIDNVELGLSSITFRNVSGEKFNFKTVTVYPFDKKIFIKDGVAFYEQKESSGKSGKYLINLDNIKLDTIYKDHKISLFNTSGTTSLLTAESIKVDDNISGTNIVLSVKDKSIKIANVKATTSYKDISINIDANNVSYSNDIINVEHTIVNNQFNFDNISANVKNKTLSIQKAYISHAFGNIELNNISLSEKDKNVIINIDGFELIGSIENKSISFDGTCQKVADILKMEDKFKGNISGSFSLNDSDIQVKQTCEFTSCLNDKMKAFNSSLVYHPYKKDHVTRFERVSGPNSSDWVYLNEIPPAIPDFFVSLEDPGFWKHNGVIIQALKNSLKTNIQQGKFVRGGSTITMQLVKNIWLDRDKKLTRKVKEVLLAWSLEKCTTKERIIETYLNVVEFGPDVYGISSGAAYHFEVSPQHLEPLEGFYLASIMPRPTGAPLGRNSLENALKLALRLITSGYLKKDAAVMLGIESELNQINTEDE